MSSAECLQPALDRVLGKCGALGIAQALRGNGTHSCQGVLDAVMEFFQDEFLKFVGRLAFSGVNSSLSKQPLGIDFGLHQQQPKTDVLCNQRVLWRRLPAPHVRVSPMKINFHCERISLPVGFRPDLSEM